MTTPLISIIIPCYNHSNSIGDAVNSVLQQSFQDFEIIIINDGSTDKDVAPKLIELSRIDPRITVIHYEQNQKPSYARNAGIRLARGYYILPVDSDDRIRPHLLRKAVSYIDSGFGDVIHWKHKEFGDTTKEWGYPVEMPSFGTRNTGVINISLFKHSDWYRVGGYDESLTKGYEDWHFYLKLMLAGCKFHFLDEVLVDYCVNKHSRNAFAMANHDELVKQIRELCKLGLIKPTDLLKEPIKPKKIPFSDNAFTRWKK